ncbi:MAG: hypothetical protein JST54_09370 [Deltaproteobacteria bacterium]|nr:hypothetical protein [Deltaproteobacteria bacterium]
MNRTLSALLLLVLGSGCAALAKDRRLAEADQNYRVKKLVVLPVMLTYKYCPDDIDKRARKDDLIVSLTKDTVDRLRTRGYTVAPLLVDASQLDAKASHNTALGKALCSGDALQSLPPEVAQFAASTAKSAGVDQVLVGGIARMRWHLKMDMGEDNGAGGDNISQFDIRAVVALYDVPKGRVVWSEFVDSKFFTGTYDDAIKRVMLFDELHGRDPHEKLFYDFPLPEGAPAPK